MAKIIAIYGSPRRRGNTALLLQKAVQGARASGDMVDEVILRDLKMSPCLEIYGCKETGRCVIQDDFQILYDQVLASNGIMLASPIFFYTVSAHTKIFMDRCQSLWVRKYWLEKRKIKYLLFFAPNKHTIYPEYLPSDDIRFVLTQGIHKAPYLPVEVAL